MEDGIKLPFGLGGDVEVKIIVPVGDVLPEVDLAGVNLLREHLPSIVGQNTASFVRFQNGKKEHVLNVSGSYHPSTLA